MRWSVTLLLILAVSCGRRTATQKPPRGGYAYPAAKTVDHVDEYHGVKVPDPYRWMEEMQSPETRAWVVAENKLTRSFLDAGDTRAPIRARLEQLWDFEKFGVPWREGERWFYKRNDGLQNQAVLYVTEELDEPGPRALLNPNRLSEDGTIALAGQTVSPNGDFLAYLVSSGGSDWREVKVRNTKTGRDLVADHLRWVKFSGTDWARDSSGFYYTRYPAPKEGEQLSAANSGGKVYFHTLGEPQDNDTLVFAMPDQPGLSLSTAPTDDGEYFLYYAFKGAAGVNALWVQKGTGPRVALADKMDGRYYVLHNDGPYFLLQTNWQAPKGRIVLVDVRSPAREGWIDIVPEAKRPVRSAMVVGGQLVVHYLRRAHSQLRVFDLDGTPDGDIPIPVGSVYGLRGRPEQPELFFGFSSFVAPPTIYRYHLQDKRLRIWRRPNVDFDPERFTAYQKTYRSKDGTIVTLFLAHRKDLVLDGNNPCLMSGYGGFNIPLTPRFSVSNVVWMEMGGVFAMPNLRGGGEYGEEWHRAGMREKKQNVFDDFITAAERLIYNRYTSKRKLAIRGGSNGGLLVGACMTQRPDLFAACLPAVGVMDMLRYHKFTIGHAWTGEYGSSDEADMFPVLYRYSPYHRIRRGVSYPATMVTTGDHDDRVVPAHSYKFAARLQAAQSGPAPILIRVETRAGHGAGTPTSKRIDQAADSHTFLAKTLGINVRDLGK